MKAYYDRRAPEYDEWYRGVGRYAERDRPGWDDEVTRLIDVIEALPSARVLDVACGTAFLTRHLRGDVTALDQALEFVREDEAVEVTPNAVRLRKAELDATARVKTARARARA